MRVDRRTAACNACVPLRGAHGGDGGISGIEEDDLGRMCTTAADDRVRRMIRISHPGQELWTGLMLSRRSVDIAGDVTKGRYAWILNEYECVPESILSCLILFPCTLSICDTCSNSESKRAIGNKFVHDDSCRERRRIAAGTRACRPRGGPLRCRERHRSGDGLQIGADSRFTDLPSRFNAASIGFSHHAWHT